MTKAKTQLVSTNELLTSTKDINSLIINAVRDAVALQRIFQVVGCSVIQHLAEHKDIRIVRDLFTKLPDSLNVNSMKEFINKYGTVRFDDTGEVHYDGTKELKLGASMENAWWKAKAQAPYKPFDFNLELDKLLKRATSKLEKPKEGDEVTQEQIEAIRTAFYAIKMPLDHTSTRVNDMVIDTTELLPTLSDVA